MLTVTDIALLAVRLMLAAVFIIHGGQKLFSWMGGAGVKGTAENIGKSGVAPAHRTALAWLATLSEFGGGLRVGLGLLTPLAASLIISVMLVAIMTVHFKNGWLNGNRGIEFNLSLITLALALVLLGAGGLSLDHLLGLATSIDHDPAYVPIILALVMLGGVATTQLSRRMNRANRA
jgi:putative oxidoreductase